MADSFNQPGPTDRTVSPNVIAGMVIRCVVAVSLLAVIMVIGFIATHRAARLSQQNAELVDLTSRQRKFLNLSGLYSERLAEAESEEQRDKFRLRLAESAAQLEQAHRSLLKIIAEDPNLGSDETIMRVVNGHPHTLNDRTDSFLKSVEALSMVENDDLSPQHPAAKKVRETISSEKLLSAQDALVQIFMRRIDQAHSRLLFTQWMTLLLGLLSLLITGWSVLRPMIHRVRNETERLKNANQLLDQQAEKLSKALSEVRHERGERRNRIRSMANVMADLEYEQSELQRVAEDLEEKQRRINELLNATAEGIYGIGLNGICTFANPSAAKMLGFRAPSDLLGLNMHELIHHSFPDGTAYPNNQCQIYRSFRDGEKVNVDDEVFWRKDGSPLAVEYWSYPILRDGVVNGAVVTFIDISERKRVASEVARINRELLQKNKEVQQFVYTVSHDLKSPLVTCKGFVGIMREDAEAGRWDDMLDSVTRVERATERMNALIDDLLQLSRIGEIRNEPELIDVSELVGEIVNDLSSHLTACVARVVVQPDMPPVVGDRVRFAELFENLLNNAIKYGCSNPEPEISVGGSRHENELWYFVSDNGLGIAPEFHERIFQLFQRLSTDKQGSGVGLAAVARIAEVHGGRTWVESEPGRGASFWMAFPTDGQG